MDKAQVDVQGSLFEGLPEEDCSAADGSVVLQAQQDGTLRAIIPSPESAALKSLEQASKEQETALATNPTPAQVQEEAQPTSAEPCGPGLEEEAEEEAEAAPLKPGFTECWLAYRAAVLESVRLIGEVGDMRFGFLNVGRGIGKTMSDFHMLRETQSDLISRIYNLAEQTFAPPGGKLSIERNLMDLGEDADFDPDKLWFRLEAEFGGDAGVELGLKQLAVALVDKFGLKYKPPIRKQNRLEIQQRMHAEKSFSGGYEYSYNSIEYLRQGHRALEDFCKWAEDFATSSNLAAGLREIKSFVKLESRKRTDFGGIQTVQFKEYVLYELYGDLADKFHEFIAIYGAEALAEKH